MVNARSGADDPGRAIAHVPALDGVRGIAVSAVLALHFGVAADFTNRFPGTLSNWLERVLYAGWAGVDLFFVLSGFLITSILLASKDGAGYFRRFYARRVLRIFPLYYTALILGLVLLPRLAPGHAWGLLRDGESGDVWLWTYSFNIGLAFGLIAMPVASLSHFWTLAIEEQFYLVWPWLVKVTSARGLLRVCVGVACIALAMRVAWVSLGYDPEGAYRFTLTRADSLTIGAVVAILMRDERWRLRLTGVSAIALALSVGAVALMIAIVPRFYPSDPLVVTVGHTILGVLSASLIVAAVRQDSWPWLANRTLRGLGKYSYGIYVWHFPLQRALLEWYGFQPPSSGVRGVDTVVFLVAGIGGSVVLGWMSYVVIERPFLRLKRFFVYSEPEADPLLTTFTSPTLTPSSRGS
ncbi:MAG: acyltransferase [Vicinamibacterales bacterium]